MEYIVKVNDKEYGPIEYDILARWVEDGRVLGDSLVRNSKLNIWKRADSFAFLRKAFEIQQSRFMIVSNKPEGKIKPLSPSEKLKTLSIDDSKTESTEFKNSFLPDKANILLRFKAGLIDLILVFCFFLISALFTSYLSDVLNIKDETLCGLLMLSISFFIILLYFAATLGVFAQTVGMWYYGLILVRNGDEAKEVYLLRAFCYTVLLSILWIISPVFNYILGNKRTLHDIITDTQVVKISARRS